MTVRTPNNEPAGTFTKGYDQGRADRAAGAPKAHKAPLARHRDADLYRYGYTEGWGDEDQQQKAKVTS